MIWNPVTQAMLWERQSAEEIKRSADHRLRISVRTHRRSLVRAVLPRLLRRLVGGGRYYEQGFDDQSGDYGQEALTTERVIHSY